MNIIVTGGSGFLGRHLCRALAKQGHSIKNIDLVENSEFETVIADVRDQDSMMREIRDAEVVFHLASLIQAGESVKEPHKYVDYNIVGSLNILEAMRENEIKTLIFSSSAAVYGEPLSVPIKEDDRTIPINPYGVTKLTLEGLLSSYVSSHDFTGVALRYFNLYGPEEHHQPETHAIPRFISQIYNGEEVTVWGSGEHKRDYIHIRDIVAAHLNALDLAVQEPHRYHYFNVSTNKPNSVMEIVTIIEELLKKKAKIKHFPERPGDPMVLTADASKAEKILGWKSNVSIQEGLEETIDYFVSLWEK